jgi:putative redox protein
MREATVTTAAGKYRQTVRIGPHTLASDAAVEVGGGDAGPEPHEWLLASLAACTSITIDMYATRKGWPLEGVEVTVSGSKVDGVFVLTRKLTLKGDLTVEQRARLYEIANKCPVHRDLSGPIRIVDDAP